MAEVLRGCGSAGVSFPASAGVAKVSECSRSKGCVSFGRGAATRNALVRSGLSWSAGILFPGGELQGVPVILGEPKRFGTWRGRREAQESVQVRAGQTMFLPRSMRWWDKGVTPNMREVHSAQELIDSLLNAGDKLVVVNFFSPGCGACRSLHPKICQLADMNPDVEFVKVNYEENKSMCYSLNIHVLPFFQFYRGAQGRLCSFSCTNATIKKFKDALAKHNTPRCSLGPPKGFGEPELLALANNKSLSFNMPAHVVKEDTKFLVGSDRNLEDLAPLGTSRNPEDSAPVGPEVSGPFKSDQKSDEPAIVGAGR
uniref:Thioredoxin domain-containing protein n=1 Tax=Araucaria cunninghamii TaxID=56994 RepID=A0A0D6QZ46_ARACU